MVIIKTQFYKEIGRLRNDKDYLAYPILEKGRVGNPITIIKDKLIKIINFWPIYI